MYGLLLIWITLNTTSQDLITALKLTCLNIGGTRYISFDSKEINPINYSLPRFDKNTSFLSISNICNSTYVYCSHRLSQILILIFKYVGWLWGFVHFPNSLNAKAHFVWWKGYDWTQSILSSTNNPSYL